MAKKTEFHLSRLNNKQYSKALYLYSIIERIPWVFYVSIKVRRKWFSYWWSTRGTNSKEIQVWIFQINIGLPWREEALECMLREYGTLGGVKEINDANLNVKCAFQVGKYPHVL